MTGNFSGGVDESLERHESKQRQDESPARLLKPTDTLGRAGGCRRAWTRGEVGQGVGGQGGRAGDGGGGFDEKDEGKGPPPPSAPSSIGVPWQGTAARLNYLPLALESKRAQSERETGRERLMGGECV